MYSELLAIQRHGGYSPRNRVVSFKSYRALRSNLLRHVVCISCSSSCSCYEKYTRERISQERTVLFSVRSRLFADSVLRIWREICKNFPAMTKISMFFRSFLDNARILETFLRQFLKNIFVSVCLCLSTAVMK